MKAKIHDYSAQIRALESLKTEKANLEKQIVVFIRTIEKHKTTILLLEKDV